jgi:hypothetical protein
MLLATVLLLCPLPQTGEAAKAAQAAADHQATASAANVTSSKDSGRTDSLPSAPEPKANASGAAANPAHPAAFPVAAIKPAEAKSYETPAKRRAWYALSIAGSGAASFDAWSTRRDISANAGTEANPLLRPFAHSNSIYAVTQLSPLLMDFVGKRMMVSRHPLLRKMWWLPQSAGMATSLAAGAHNMTIGQ